MISKVYQDPERPWRLDIFELLPTKAPGPHLSIAYCCYRCTVIFYVRPYIVRPWHSFWMSRGKRLAQKPGNSYQEWDKLDTRLHWHTPVFYRGKRFEMQGGSVVWEFGRWWMHHRLRREPSLSQQAPASGPKSPQSDAETSRKQEES